MFYIKSEAYISEKGKNNINEDTLAYIKGRLYMVCDGVGGNGNGLLASQILSESIYNSLKDKASISVYDAVKVAEKTLERYKDIVPKAIAMASTLALTQIKENSVLIAWIGDSRVYQFRDGKIIYKTTDHTKISELIKNGSITEHEALFHPDVNILTKVIKGSKQPVAIEQVILTDVEEDDYFLICSDGIIESWIDADLIALFSKTNTPDNIIEVLGKQCSIFSNDNYTAIVYQLGINK
jgi:protein phosphatase